MSDFVTVAVFGDQTEAMVARSVLEAAGIDCLLKGEHQIGVQPFLMTGKQGMQLQVFSEDAEAAKAILAEAQDQ
jgi:hypothetical protein